MGLVDGGDSGEAVEHPRGFAGAIGCADVVGIGEIRRITGCLVRLREVVEVVHHGDERAGDGVEIERGDEANPLAGSGFGGGEQRAELGGADAERELFDGEVVLLRDVGEGEVGRGEVRKERRGKGTKGQRGGGLG